MDQLTSANSPPEQLLYFTSSSLTSDDKKLVALSEIDGQPNLVCINLESGERLKLTENSDGILKSYVYFDGKPYKGFGKASISLDPDREVIYYIQGNKIIALSLDGRSRELNILPDDVMTGFTHVSADGRRFCIPTVDARALDGNRQFTNNHPGYDVDKRIQDERLSSHLRVYDTATGEQLIAEPVPLGWVTHVQFSPLDSNLILYNHEWCADSGVRRMWLWDGSKHIALRDEKDGRTRKDWACHEMWERDGTAIIYHGAIENGSGFVGRFDMNSKELIEIPFETSYKKYGHFTVGNSNILVSDGYYARPDDKPSGWGGDWISVQTVNWEKRKIRWHPLCLHGSTWKSQDEHPHPIFNHAGDTIYFNSDRSGQRAIYRVSVETELRTLDT